MSNENQKKGAPVGDKPSVTGDELRKLLQGRFHERLYQCRAAQGWSQSELARHLWGVTTDGRGYEVARNRDRISAYEAQRSTPTRDNLILMACLFDLDPDELAPDLGLDRPGGQSSENPTFRMAAVPGHPEQSLLTVNAITSTGLAARIMQLLSEDAVAQTSMTKTRLLPNGN